MAVPADAQVPQEVGACSAAGLFIAAGIRIGYNVFMRRRCKTGYLVGGLFRIPDDSSVAGVADSANPVGCSRLHCSDCGRQVRQAGGLAVGRGRSPSDLCDAPDWTRLDCVRTDPDARLYCCACVLHVEFSWRLLGDTEERMSLPRFRGCAGHPEPAGAESSGYG